MSANARSHPYRCIGDTYTVDAHVHGTCRLPIESNWKWQVNGEGFIVVRGIVIGEHGLDRAPAGIDRATSLPTISIGKV